MSVAIVGQVIVSEAGLLFGVGSGSLDFGPEMDKIGLAGDGEVDVVTGEEIVEIDVLGLALMPAEKVGRSLGNVIRRLRGR